MTPSVLLDPPSPSSSSDLAPQTKTPVTTQLPSHEPALLHRSLLEQPHNVASASGSYLYLNDGRAILDACGGAAVAIIGHGDERVIAAATEQMRKVSYVHTMAYTTDSAEDLAECILRKRGTYDHGLTKAFFVSSGSEANDTAMKCARQYWVEKGEPQRRLYVARRQGYHGNTIGAMSVSSVIARKIPYEAILLPNVSFVTPADALHHQASGETEEAFVDRLIQELEAEFLRLGPENIISFIGETVGGATLGAMSAPTGYWRAVRALCDKYGILLHLDEIMCGMGRTGTYFAFEQEGIQPDIVTIGKGLGGGYAPIAGMLINDKIVKGLRAGTSAFNHGHTYQAHPVTCATALAVQNVLDGDDLVARVAEKGELLDKLLREAFEDSKYVADIRGRGLFRAVEFMADTKAKLPFNKSVGFGPGVQHAAFDLGVAVYPGAGTIDGIRGDHVLIAPPYNVTDEELRTTVTTLKKAYDMMASKIA